MGKINLNSRSNYSSIYGLIEKYADTISQKVNEDSDVIFKNLTLSESLTVNGNLTVNGSTTVISTETIEFQDNIIEINAGELGPGVSSNLSGIQINRGLASPYQFVFEETSDSFKIGQINDLQTVATREDAPLPNGLMIFDNDSRLIVSTNEIPIDITFNGSGSIGSSTGAVRVQGGLGVSQDMFIDGKIHVKGIGYGNTISGNAANDLVVRADNDFTIDVSSGKSINIPDNVALSVGTTSVISSDTSHLNINSNGNVQVAAGALTLKTNTNLIVESGTGSIEFDDLSFNGNNMEVNSVVNINDTLNVSGLTFLTNTAEPALAVAGGAVISGSLTIEGQVSLLENTFLSKKLTLGVEANAGNLTEPLSLNIRDFMYTDDTTAVLGVVARANCNYIGSTTLSAINPGVSVNTSSSLFIAGPPLAGTNMTLIDTFSLNVNSGTSRFNGHVLMASSNVTGEVSSNSLVSAKISITGSINAGPGSTGKYLDIGPYSINDAITQGQGTASDMLFNVIAAGLLTATNTVTTTNAATFVINGAPIAQTNQTLVNAYALWVKSGLSKFIDIETNSLLTQTITTDSIEGNTLTVTGFSGLDSTRAFRLLAGTDDLPMTSMTSVVYESHGATTESNTTSDFIGFSGFKTPNVSGTGVTTEAATLYIQGSPTVSGSHTIDNSYSLVVQSGATKLNGQVLVTDTSSSSLVVSGGAGIAGKLDTNQLNVPGLTTLAETSVNTNTGQFQVSGNDGINLNVASSSTFTTSAGFLELVAENGPVLVNGQMGVTMDSAGSVNINSNANSVFNSGVGSLGLSGAGMSLTSSGTFKVASSSKAEIDSLETINIGLLNPGIPVYIGASASETNIGNNLTVIGNLTVQGETTTLNSRLITTDNNAIVVNSMPSGLSDGGLLVKRYQIPNNTSIGQVVQDVRFESDVFAADSVGNVLYLGASALAVNDHYKGWWIKITSGTGAGQVRRIKAYAADTKEATVYGTADNTDTFQDGLDIATLVVAGDSYNLYPGTFAGMFFDDTNDEWVIGRVPFDEFAGRFPLQDYSALHVHSLLLETGIEYSGNSIGNGSLTLDGTDAKTFLVRKENDTGNVFYVNTLEPAVSINNPSNFVGTGASLFLNSNNNFNVEVNYAAIKTSIISGVSGSLTASLDFNLISGSEPINLLSLNSDTNTSTFSSKCHVSNTLESTSSSSGALTVAGGVGVLGNMTIGGTATIDSVLQSDSTSSGAVVVAGGLGVAKNIHAGGNLVISGTTTAQSIVSINPTIPTASTSSITGALVVAGGVGVSGDINTSGNFATPGIVIESGGNLYGASENYTHAADTQGRMGFVKKSGQAPTLGFSSTSFFSLGQYSVSNLLVGDISTASYTPLFTVSNDKTEILHTTSSVSTTTGALVVAGGVGIAESLFVGLGVNAQVIGIGTTTGIHSLNLNQNNNGIGLSGNSGRLILLGGSSQASSIELHGATSAIAFGDLNLKTAATGDLNVFTQNTLKFSVKNNGQVSITALTDATDAVSGSLTTLGGASVGKKMYIGSDLHVIGSSHFTQISSGVWDATIISVPKGGTGVGSLAANSLVVGNGVNGVLAPLDLTYSSSTLQTPTLKTTDTTQATSSTAGSVEIVGGLAVAKNAYIGTTLYTGGNIGVGTSENVNSELTMAKDSVIGLNTLGGVDDGFLCISGSGTSSESRGGVITLFGQESLGTGSVVVSATSLIDLKTGGTSRVQVLGSGTVALPHTTASTNSGSGSLVMQGGLSIANSTNSVSSTNGGSLTSAGGAAVAKDMYIGGDLHVIGSVINASAVMSPTLTFTGFVNIFSVFTTNVKVISVNQERTLSATILVGCSAGFTRSQFDFDVPYTTDNLDFFNFVPNVQGFADVNSEFVNVENITCTPVSGATIRISFTSVINFGSVYLQVILRY